MRFWVFLLIAFLTTLTTLSFADPYFGSAPATTTDTKKTATVGTPPLSVEEYQQAAKKAAQESRDKLTQQFKQQLADQPRPGAPTPSTPTDANANPSMSPPTTTTPPSKPAPPASTYTGFPAQTPTTQPSNESGGWNVKY